MAAPHSITSEQEFSNKVLLDHIRPLLQRDKIRLWEPPYTDASSGVENIPEARSYTVFLLFIVVHEYIHIILGFS